MQEPKANVPFPLQDPSLKTKATKIVLNGKGKLTKHPELTKIDRRTMLQAEMAAGVAGAKIVNF